MNSMNSCKAKSDSGERGVCHKCEEALCPMCSSKPKETMKKKSVFHSQRKLQIIQYLQPIYASNQHLDLVGGHPIFGMKTKKQC
jgi:hypothetical protein